MRIISFGSQQGDKNRLYLSFEIKKLWSRDIKTQALMPVQERKRASIWGCGSYLLVT